MYLRALGGESIVNCFVLKSDESRDSKQSAQVCLGRVFPSFGLGLLALFTAI